MADDPPSIERDELLYRRMSKNANPRCFDEMSPGPAVKQVAFTPHRKRDTDGISLIRAKERTADRAARALESPGKYALAVVRAGDLMDLGLHLDISPDEEDATAGTAAHVTVRELNASNYDTDETAHITRQIAELFVLEIIGPFPAE